VCANLDTLNAGTTVLTLNCGGCSWPLPPEFWNRDAGAACPGCGWRVQALVFPAIRGTRSGELPEAVGVETEASCFFHPTSRAAVPCDACGRFLCRLCDLEIHGRHLCPGCFEKGVATQKLDTMETRRTMYDSLALMYATLPLVLVSPAVIGAPVALYTVLRRWNAPSSVTPRTRIRFYIAAVLALFEIAFFGGLIWALTRVPSLTTVPK
jgi:hypothetical protein